MSYTELGDVTLPELVLCPLPPVVVPEEADDPGGQHGEHHDRANDGDDHSLGSNWGKMSLGIFGTENHRQTLVFKRKKYCT